jgi:hypothetical protein
MCAAPEFGPHYGNLNRFWVDQNLAEKDTAKIGDIDDVAKKPVRDFPAYAIYQRT